MKFKYIVVILMILALMGCAKQETKQETAPVVTGQVVQPVVEQQAQTTEPVQLPKPIPKTQAPNPPTPQTQHVVEIYNSAFVPASVTIKVGETVTWKVLEGAHIVGDLRRNFRSDTIHTGDTYMVTFDQPGRYNYIDQVRKFYGEIIVQ